MKYIECPQCKDKLNPDAKACACGWKKAAHADNTPTKDLRCTFTFAGQRCYHPVGFFDQGSFSGWCIFHRSVDPKDSPELAKNIVMDSDRCSPEQYLKMAKAKTYGIGDSWEVARIRAQLNPNAPEGFKIEAP